MPTWRESAAQAGHAWSYEERLLRALRTNRDFTIFVSVAVAITVMFAYVFVAGSASDCADGQEICR
ncbi:MAG: hypothetical protein ACXU9Y_16615 [Gemmatimonadaceae bacterium]